MGDGTTWFPLLETACSYAPFLGTEGPLEEDRPLEIRFQTGTQSLFLTDGIELRPVMLFPGSILAANLITLLEKVVEVFSEIAESSPDHFLRKPVDAFLHLPAFGIIGLVFPVAEKAAPLVDVVESTPKDIPIPDIGQVKLLRKGAMPVVIRVSVQIGIGALPSHKLFIEGIYLLVLPLLEIRVGQVRAKSLPDQHPEQLDLSHPPTEIMPAGSPGGSSLLDCRFFPALVMRYPVLEDMDALVDEHAGVVLVPADNRPAD